MIEFLVFIEEEDEVRFFILHFSEKKSNLDIKRYVYVYIVDIPVSSAEATTVTKANRMNSSILVVDDSNLK